MFDHLPFELLLRAFYIVVALQLFFLVLRVMLVGMEAVVALVDDLALEAVEPGPFVRVMVC